MCAAKVLSLLSKNFTLRLSGEFDHVLVASNNAEICVVSRSVFMDNYIYVFYEGSQSGYIGLKVHLTDQIWLRVELRITFLSIRKTVILIKNLKRISQGASLGKFTK